jgi:predicted ABC-type ATPase
MARRSAQRDDEGWLTQYDGRPVWRLSDLKKARKTNKPMYAINIKGCNGSGKSTIPIRMIDQEKGHVYLTTRQDDKKPVATILPVMGVVIFGSYLTNCGGCDALPDTKKVQELLKDLWTKDIHIIYEGVIVGDIYSTFKDIMVAFNEVWPREVSFCFMGTKFKECLRRIQGRNGGKPINEELVRQKYKNSLRHITGYAEEGLDCKVLDTTGNISQVVARFMNHYPDLGPPF